MISPIFPKNEAQRLSEVNKYHLLDTPPEEQFDNITELIASICEAPICLITLLDTERNFLKSHHGIDLSEFPRNISSCGHAILEDEDLFVIEDATKDIRFYDNPKIEEFNTVFYAGAPLVNDKGFTLGTLCVYDMKPRKLTEIQKKAIVLMAKQVVNLFELHLKNVQLVDIQKEQVKRNQRLNAFAHHVSHDLKSPLANITSLTRLLREENEENLNEESLQYLEYIEESSVTLKNYINGILEFYKTAELLEVKKEDVPVAEFFSEIKEMLILNDDQFIYPNTGILSHVNKAALTQIVMNLVDNAFKYNPNDTVLVEAKYINEPLYHKFKIIDNGLGIEKDIQSEIFEMFKTTGIKDRNGNRGTGIGLATVYSLVTKLGGEIWVDSELGKGSTFTFTIKK